MKFVGVITVLFSVFSCKQIINYTEVNSAIEKSIDSIIEGGNFNGVIRIVKADSLIYQKCKGYSDFNKNEILKSDDHFVIGSISKQITAVLILQFYERDQLTLSDTIGQYLTDVGKEWKSRITIHQLLTHTHGITSLSNELENEPGTKFNYSQIGYDLLAKILEKITGTTFQEITTSFFKKYDLNNTFHPNSLGEKVVFGYEKIDSLLLKMENSTENYVAAGSIISNVDDLIRWNYLLHSNQLLKKETFKLMKSRYATRVHPIFGEIEYGYGLLFKQNENNVQIGALGYAPGFVSCCYYFPESNYNVVILENVAQDIPDFKRSFNTQVQVLEFIKNVK